MSKAWAKLVVTFTFDGCWRVGLQSNLSGTTLLHKDTKGRFLDICNGRSAALARARAWSRRLGNIPVEVANE